MNIVQKRKSCEVMGASCEVYREQSNGFVEAVYQERLEIEFGERKISFKAQPELVLACKGRPRKSQCKPDFICHDRIVTEGKAASALTDERRAQVQNHLRATGMQLELLINFGHHPKLEYERIVL